jgi:hypothetical protein
MMKPAHRKWLGCAAYDELYHIDKIEFFDNTVVFFCQSDAERQMAMKSVAGA